MATKRTLSPRLSRSHVHLHNEYVNWIFQRDVFAKIHEVEFDLDDRFANHLLILHAKLCEACFKDNPDHELHHAGAAAGGMEKNWSGDTEVAGELPDVKAKFPRWTPPEDSIHTEAMEGTEFHFVIKKEPVDPDDSYPNPTSALASGNESPDQPGGSSNHRALDQQSGSSTHSALDQPSGLSAHSAPDQPSGSSAHSALDQPSGSSAHSALDQPRGLSAHSALDQPSGSSAHTALDQPSGSSLSDCDLLGSVKQPDDSSVDGSLYQPSEESCEESGDQQSITSGDTEKPGTSHDIPTKMEIDSSAPGSITCKECDTHFTSALSLAHHLKDHHRFSVLEPTAASSAEEIRKFTNQRDPGHFVCKTCGAVFTSDFSFAHHLKDQHGFIEDAVTTNTSPDHSITLTDQSGGTIMDEVNVDYGRKISESSLEQSTKCELCGKNFKSLNSLKSHKCPLGENRFTCDVCGKTFRFSCLLSTHKLKFPSDSHCSCDICGRAYKESSDLKRHKLLHPISETHWCDICSKPFSNAVALDLHKESKSYSCVICNEVFSCCNTFKLHEQTTHFDIEKLNVGTLKCSHDCNACGLTFTDLNLLQNHNCAKRDVTLYNCNVCKQRFATPGALNTHFIIHTGEKHHRCDACDKTFPTVSALNNHYLIHSGEKPHTCNVCYTSFSLYNDLVAHRRVHKTDKIYTCDVCGKSSKYLSTITQHKLTHTGERPFVCDICGESFKSKYYLKKHKHVHTDEEMNETTIINVEELLYP